MIAIVGGASSFGVPSNKHLSQASSGQCARVCACLYIAGIKETEARNIASLSHLTELRLSTKPAMTDC